MGVTLVINPGSSSKKYACYADGQRVFTLAFEKTTDGIELTSELRGERRPTEYFGHDAYRMALTHAIEELQASELIASAADIERVCIRIVAPGTRFQAHATVDAGYIADLRAVEAAAPLHIPHMLAEIETIRRTLPNTPLVAASDSAFHSTLPPVARTYSIPQADTEAYDLYQFGYHGLSVASVARRLPQLLGHQPARTIIAHIGSGVSVTALRDGSSVDTSMGFAPGTGLMMASRAGDVDTGALLELMRVKHLKLIDAHQYLQTQGGLQGVAGDRDLRRVLERRASGDAVARHAIEQFSYNLKKVIGAYVAALGGLDALILTATASERSAPLRRFVLSGLEPLGITLNEEQNEQVLGRDGVLSAAGAATTVAVMRTDEMGEMYRVATELV